MANTSKNAATPSAKRRRARPLAEGIATLTAAIKTLPSSPGVYRMLAASGEPLYVGKARNLRKRVTSYIQIPRLPVRLLRMVAETTALEVITTHTEAEALLLESNLIKKFEPRYNIQLRDDKSFPYILLTTAQKWPRAIKYRGSRGKDGEYFGPYATAGAVNRALDSIERAFLLRSCTDAVFANRTRPCLKYQIKRCSAPCVGHVDAAGYAALVGQARDFLSGKSSQVPAGLAQQMEAASNAEEFERAARLRDRIRALAALQAHQDINLEAAGLDEADIIAAHAAAGQVCVQVFFFRGGRNNGNRAYFPRHLRDSSTAEVLTAFIGQFYDNKQPPRVVLLSERLAESALIAAALTQKAGHAVALLAPARGAKRKLVQHALDNARDALARKLSEGAAHADMLSRVATVFSLQASPRRIEVYDNSHISGTGAVGAMIVAGPEGFEKSSYRRFTIRAEEAISPGDDYAMMRQVFNRRFARALKEDPERILGQWPDLVLIDGGQGQLNAAAETLDALGVKDVALVAIAKGPDRDAGRERFFQPDRAPFTLDARNPLMYFLQRLRDEAHRFAIGGHRAKRSRAIVANPLDEVHGIGGRRKKALLHYFGSAKAVSRAGIEDLERVMGISHAVAKRVYDHFHGVG
ncbi:MAG: excinuclease ABC subunit UvrC [Alphaproteobacteria bacterium]|nr:excinuclease ABC subunit UvrC [Alphaproteobacteria bacterium]